jgi:Tfp pilus assembly protein PilW
MTASGLRPRADDDGFSLTELMVNMSVMSLVMVVFTGGIAQLYQAQNHSEALTSVTQQIHIAFVRLDRDIRYASGISDPGAAVTGNEYVEFEITNVAPAVCTQLRLTPSGQLQIRRKAGTAAAGSWSALASQLIEPSTFVRTAAADSGNAYQQLVVSLTARAGGAAKTENETATFTFTALNTSVATTSDSVCNSLDRP